MSTLPTEPQLPQLIVHLNISWVNDFLTLLFCFIQAIPAPSGRPCIDVEGYWVSQGEMEPVVDPNYILTASVKLNLRDLSRVVSAG